MNLKKVHPDFGIEIKDIKINNAETKEINEILNLFEEYSLIVFKNQKITNEEQLDLASLSDCIENFSKIKTLSKERVQIEFNKLLLSKNISFALLILKKHNLLNFLIDGFEMFIKSCS